MKIPSGFALMAVAGTFFIATSTSHSQTITLGTAANYAILGGTTVTNTGPTTISGDLGVAPGTAITGFGPGIVNGTIHSNDASSIQAQTDALAAYNMLTGLPVTQILTGQDLGGLTLTPGVYQFASSAQLTGTLTLDGLGQATPLFVFQIGSTLTTASLSMIDLLNGADASNVFFQVGSSATLGTGTQFEGTIIAAASDTLTTGATVNGRVIALGGAVTLDTNTVNIAAVPEPGSCVLVLLGITLIFRRRAGRLQSFCGARSSIPALS